MNISENHTVFCMSATLLQLAVQANHQSDLSEITCQPRQQMEFSEVSWQAVTIVTCRNLRGSPVSRMTCQNLRPSHLSTVTCQTLHFLKAGNSCNITQICLLLSAVSASTLTSAEPTASIYTEFSISFFVTK